MGIPAIAPYPMPTVSQVPKSRVAWTCEPARALLLVHDMQNYFLGAFTPERSPLVELVENIDRLRAAARALDIPVVYSAQPGGQPRTQRGLQLDMWGNGVGTDPREEQIVSAIAPSTTDILLRKWRYSAFHRTELAGIMREHGRDQIVVTGIYAHIGCLMTSVDAFMHDIQAFLVADAVADFSRDDHDMALRYAAGRCAVTTTTESLIDELKKGAT